MMFQKALVDSLYTPYSIYFRMIVYTYIYIETHSTILK